MEREKISVIKDSLILVAVSVFIALAVNYLHPGGFRLVSKKRQSSFVFISPQEGKIKFDNGALFIDSRDPAVHGFSRISGAVNIPAFPEDGARAKARRLLAEIAGEREPVIYCDGDGCGSSEILAEIFIEAGYPGHLYILRSGFPGWRSAGYPVAEGE